MEENKSRKINNKKTDVIKWIKLILVVVMIVLIYMVSPLLSNGIKNIAKYLYELDCNYITRVIEILILLLCGKILLKK